jgi:hypothetical protein
LKTEIFLQRGLDTPVDKTPDGQISSQRISGDFYFKRERAGHVCLRIRLFVIAGGKGVDGRIKTGVKPPGGNRDEEFLGCSCVTCIGGSCKRGVLLSVRRWANAAALSKCHRFSATVSSDDLSDHVAIDSADRSADPPTARHHAMPPGTGVRYVRPLPMAASLPLMVGLSKMP